MIEAIICLFAIATAEFVTIYINPIWGMAGHVVILTSVIMHAGLGALYSRRPLLVSLSLVPLVRIVSLAMPLSGIPQLWWYPIICAPLLAAAIVVVRILNYTARDIRLTLRGLRVQLAVALTGLVFGIVEYFILRPEPMVAEFTWQAVGLAGLILLVCTGFVEELIFRGVLQRSTVTSFGWWGVVYVSLLFAVLHMGYFTWVEIVFAFVVSLLFGWVVKKTGSLFGVTLSHGIINIILYLIGPFFLA